MRLLSTMVIGFVLMLSACAPAPPFVAYMTAGIYSGECGYDWNGRGIFLKDAQRHAKEWRNKEVAVLFRFGNVPDACAAPAYNALRDAGFERIWVVHKPYPKSGDQPLVPRRKSTW